MKFQFRLICLLLGTVLLTVAASSSGAPTTNQTSPSLALRGGTPWTASPTAKQATNAPHAQTTLAPFTAVPSPAATGTSTPPASGADALDLIANSMRAQASAKSFRSTSLNTTAGGETSTNVIEYVAPDRVHMLRTRPGKPGTEMIIIKGQGTWQKINGTWTKSPLDMSTAAFAFLDPKFIDQLKSDVMIGTLHLIGPELLGARPTIVYQYDMSIKGLGAAGGNLKASSKVWIGVTDQRVYKVEGDSESVIKAGTKTHTVTTYEWDINIQIQPPA